jgi:hypothetical protein
VMKKQVDGKDTVAHIFEVGYIELWHHFESHNSYFIFFSTPPNSQ